MANPLDDLTAPEIDDTGRLVVYPSDINLPAAPNAVPVQNRLTQQVAPAPDDLGSLLGRLKDRLLGTGGQERYQMWPERIVRSAVTAPGAALASEEPITSEQMIAPAQDIAALAGGGALTERPGLATLGSGPVRQAMKSVIDHPEFDVRVTGPKEPGTLRLAADNMSFSGDQIRDYHDTSRPGQYVVMNELTGQVEKTFPGDEAGLKKAQQYFRKNNEPVHYVMPKGVERWGNDQPLVQFKTKDEAQAWLDQRDASKGAPRGVTLNSDTSQPGMAVAAARSGSAPVFYSALEHAATNASQDVMSPQQWLGYLKNQPGVKAEEMQWTGLGDWLGQQKGKVSKQDVQAYLDEHKTEIKDVTKGQEEHGNMEGDYSERSMNEAEDFATNVLREEYRSNPELQKQYKNFDEFIESDHALDRHGDIAENWLDENGEFQDETGGQGTKYSDYVLPGGENYREHLLTLPHKNAGPGESVFDQMSPMEQRHAQPWAKDVKPGTELYRSTHWDEPNVLAHVRTNDRDVGGKKSLHIEEIQSDWHQEGRKKGYVEPEYTAKDVQQRKGPAGDTQYFVQDRRDPNNKTNHYDTPEEAIKAANYNNQFGKGGKVPDAPFKTTWPELAMKRMIRHAAENGYERISWTPGEAQAARYDLSKQIDRVVFRKTGDSGFTRPEDVESVKGGQLIAYDKDGRKVIDQYVDHSDKLPDYIGKEAAQKLVDQKPRDVKHAGLSANERKLENADLKVGGEGMREFYDKMLPKMVEKIGKAHGVKVKQTEIGTGATPMQDKYPDLVRAIKRYPEWRGMTAEDLDRNGVKGHYVDDLKDAKALVEEMKSDKIKSVHYFDIPKSLREHAMGKGFPLYMSGVPFPLTPVDHDPFEKKGRK